MFKAESDAFINEEAAKEALKPVAEVILAHPDHKNLIGGHHGLPTAVSRPVWSCPTGGPQQ